MSLSGRLVSLFAGKRPEPSYPVLPQVRDTGESSVRGLYLVGEIGGTPLIKLDLNQGVEVVERLRTGSSVPRPTTTRTCSTC